MNGLSRTADRSRFVERIKFLGESVYLSAYKTAMGEKILFTKTAQKGRLGMRILIENNRLIVDYDPQIIDNRLHM